MPHTKTGFPEEEPDQERTNKIFNDIDWSSFSNHLPKIDPIKVPGLEFAAIELAKSLSESLSVEPFLTKGMVDDLYEVALKPAYDAVNHFTHSFDENTFKIIAEQMQPLSDFSQHFTTVPEETLQVFREMGFTVKLAPEATSEILAEVEKLSIIVESLKTADDVEVEDLNDKADDVAMELLSALQFRAELIQKIQMSISLAMVIFKENTVCAVVKTEERKQFVSGLTALILTASLIPPVGQLQAMGGFAFHWVSLWILKWIEKYWCSD